MSLPPDYRKRPVEFIVAVEARLKRSSTLSQPQPFSQGQTVVTPDQKVKAQEQKSNFVTLGKNATVEHLMRVLNASGVTPRTRSRFWKR